MNYGSRPRLVVTLYARYRKTLSDLHKWASESGLESGIVERHKTFGTIQWKSCHFCLEIEGFDRPGMDKARLFEELESRTDGFRWEEGSATEAYFAQEEVAGSGAEERGFAGKAA